MEQTKEYQTSIMLASQAETGRMNEKLQQFSRDGWDLKNMFKYHSVNNNQDAFLMLFERDYVDPNPVVPRGVKRRN